MSLTSRRRSLLVVLLALAIAPYFIGLGDSAIWDANEAFYVETPRQMVERGDVLNPSFNDQPRFNKPPLSYWIVAAFYQAFGESVVSERLAIAIGALVLMAAAFGMARAAFSTDAGIIAALAVASAPRVVMFARRIFIDVYVAMFMGLTLLCFALAERWPAYRRRYLALMYVAIALGFLTKGPVAVVLPGLVVLAYLVTRGRVGDLRSLMLPTGAIIVLAIALPWYGAIYAQHGWVYIQKFFLEENLSRYTAPYGAKVDERGPLFYLPVLLTDLFPWAIFGVVALALAAWRGWRARREAAASLPWLLVLWVVIIVGFFSASQTKQDLYIFPVVTALAALAGGLVAGGLEPTGADRSAPRWVAVTTGVLLSAAGLGLLYLFGSPARVYAIEGTALAGSVAVIAGALVVALAASRKPFGALVVLAAGAIAINWIFVVQVLPSFRQYQVVPEMAERIRAEAGPNARAGYYSMGLPSLVYYLRRPVFEAFHPDQIVEVFTSGEVWCLIRASDYEEVRHRLPTPTCVRARQPIFDVKIGNVLALRPLPELLLVTNRCGPAGGQPDSLAKESL